MMTVAPHWRATSTVSPSKLRTDRAQLAAFRQGFRLAAQQRCALAEIQQRGFRGMHPDGDDQGVAETSGGPDDVEMAQRERIERPGIESDPGHAQPRP